jgi:hypothetical protein
MSPAGNCVSSPLDEGLLIAQPVDDRIFLLNGSARFMWERLIEGVDESKIPALIAAHYGIDLARASRDFRKTLRRWHTEGLMRPNCARHCYEIARLAFDIHYHDAGLAGILLPMLTHLTTAAPRQSPPGLEIDLEKRSNKIVLRINGVEKLRTADVDKVIQKLIFSLFCHVSANADWLVSLHASAIGCAGGCVLMPGASGSGKSSLAAALLSFKTMKYVTEDVALLERATLAVIPVPTPITLKSGSWTPLHPFLPDLAGVATYRRFGHETRYWAPPRGRIARHSMPVRVIVFPRYVAGADTLLSPVRPLETMSRLTVAPCAVRPPISNQVVETLASFVRRVPAYDLTYGALGEAREVLSDLMLQ